MKNESAVIIAVMLGIIALVVLFFAIDIWLFFQRHPNAPWWTYIFN